MRLLPQALTRLLRPMKWPAELVLIRHGQSAYNVLRERKEADGEYRKFRELFDKDPEAPLLDWLARRMQKRYALGVSDYETPLTEQGRAQAVLTGARLAERLGLKLPHVVFFSPYLRTRQTYDGLVRGWPALRQVKAVPDERIREQEHGLSLLYNDWRVFFALHPEQRALNHLLGDYWYEYPQGESVPQVRDRNRLFTDMLVRECPRLRVWVISHHLNILSVRANYERLSPEEFRHLDEHEKPVNCGVTIYRGDPSLGKRGKLVLAIYNQKLF